MTVFKPSLSDFAINYRPSKTRVGQVMLPVKDQYPTLVLDGR